MNGPSSHVTLVSAVRRARTCQADAGPSSRSEAIRRAVDELLSFVACADLGSSTPDRHVVDLCLTCIAALEEARRDPASNGLERAAALLAPLELLAAA